MSTLGNIVWFIFGGFVMGLAWFFYGIIAFISIVGIPWGRSCFMLAKFSFFPFGNTVIDRKLLSGKEDLGTGAFGAVGNIIWFVLAGWILALAHLFCGIIMCVSIIFIPFGIQHFKLAAASLFPVGKAVVSNAVAEAAIRADAEEQVYKTRG